MGYRTRAYRLGRQQGHSSYKRGEQKGELVCTALRLGETCRTVWSVISHAETSAIKEKFGRKCRDLAAQY